MPAQPSPRQALAELRRLAERRGLIEAEIADQVAVARSLRLPGAWSVAAACTWEEIGRALGVTAQAVSKRYGPALRGA